MTTAKKRISKSFFYKLGIGMKCGGNRYEQVELICGMRGMQNIICENVGNAEMRKM